MPGFLPGKAPVKVVDMGPPDKHKQHKKISEQEHASRIRSRDKRRRRRLAISVTIKFLMAVLICKGILVILKAWEPLGFSLSDEMFEILIKYPLPEIAFIITVFGENDRS